MGSNLTWQGTLLGIVMLTAIYAVGKAYRVRAKERNWKAHRLHKEAEVLMQNAWVAGHKGKKEVSELFYYRTCIYEEQAAQLTNHPLSKGVLYRSGAWCAIHAGEPKRAIRLAEAGLKAKNVPEEIRDELIEALKAALERWKAQLLPEEPIRAWFDENLIWCDGPQLSVLKSENGDKYLSIWVDEKGDNLIYLCAPVSEEELKKYDFDDETYNIHTIYAAATKFYTNSYDDFDGDTYILRPINREDIPADWWPGK